MAIAALRVWTRQAIKNGGLRNFKVRQPQDRFAGLSSGMAFLFLLHEPVASIATSR
jgi:hypothetical protein